MWWEQPGSHKFPCNPNWGMAVRWHPCEQGTGVVWVTKLSVKLRSAEKCRMEEIIKPLENKSCETKWVGLFTTEKTPGDDFTVVFNTGKVTSCSFSSTPKTKESWLEFLQERHTKNYLISREVTESLLKSQTLGHILVSGTTQAQPVLSTRRERAGWSKSLLTGIKASLSSANFHPWIWKSGDRTRVSNTHGGHLVSQQQEKLQQEAMCLFVSYITPPKESKTTEKGWCQNPVWGVIHVFAIFPK